MEKQPVDFLFKQNNITHFRDFTPTNQTKVAVVEEKKAVVVEEEEEENDRKRRPHVPSHQNKPKQTNNADRTPLLEPRRMAPTSSLLSKKKDNRNTATGVRHPAPTKDTGNDENEKEFMEYLGDNNKFKKGFMEYSNDNKQKKNGINHSNDNKYKREPHPLFSKKQMNDNNNVDIDDLYLDVEVPTKSPSLSSTSTLIKQSNSHHDPLPPVQNLESFIQSYRKLQSECHGYQSEIERYKSLLSEERNKVEQHKSNLNNVTCLAELDLIRHQHTEMRMQKWDENTIVFQSVMTSMKKLVSQKSITTEKLERYHQDRSTSMELEKCKSKMMSLYRMWSNQILGVQSYQQLKMKYKSVLLCVSDEMKQQRTSMTSLSHGIRKQLGLLYDIKSDIHSISQELCDLKTSVDLEAVTIGFIKSETTEMSKNMHHIHNSLRDIEEMAFIEYTNELSLNEKYSQLERENKELKKEILVNEKGYQTDLKMLEEEKQDLLAQIAEAQAPKRRKMRKLPAV